VLLFQTTGLTGLAVAANSHHMLGVLYGKILRALQKMPSSAAYRKYTEQIIKERADIVKNVSFLVRSLTGMGQH
jgi:NADH dehydrogenase (ubiquinone) 1 alpha subcomplex subunit 5